MQILLRLTLYMKYILRAGLPAAPRADMTIRTGKQEFVRVKDAQ